MVPKSLLKPGFVQWGEGFSPGWTQVLPGTSLPALLLGVWGKGPLGFVRDRIPIVLLKKMCSSVQQDETMDR